MNQDKLNQKLFEAAGRGDAGEVLSLLDGGADVHAADDYALRWAALNGRTEVVALLLDRGADVHARDDRALCCAAINGHTEVVALLLAQPTYTVSRLRAAMDRFREDGWEDTVASRMITARIDVLTAEDLAKRAGESGLLKSQVAPDGGLGL